MDPFYLMMGLFSVLVAAAVLIPSDGDDKPYRKNRNRLVRNL